MCCASPASRSCCARRRPCTRPGGRPVRNRRRRCVMTEAATPTHAAPVLEARSVTRQFVEGGVTLTVLAQLELAVARAERLAIIGASGSGKTTLLPILGGLDRPDAGEVRIDGQDIHRLGERERGALRNRTIGFVYQFHHLLPEFSALENVAMPLLVRRMQAREARARAAALLERVGLSARLRHRPPPLAGGER